jgi:hypothetical protein
VLQTSSTSAANHLGASGGSSLPRIATVWILALGCSPLMVSCKGPMYLSVRDFDTGRTAFEALEQKREAVEHDDSEATDRWEKVYRSKLIRKLSPESPAFDAILDYDLSISLKGLTRAEISIAKVDKDSARSSPEEASGARQKYEKLTGRYPDVEAAIRVCRDDAAKYFITGVPATGTCDQRLGPLKKAYDAEHPKQL